MTEAPAWLADFQERFSKVLATPLDRMEHTRRERLPEGWQMLNVLPRARRPAAAGLGDYQRQYWFRLFTLLQEDFPLTSRLQGLQTFHEEAERYLLEKPPTGHDLAMIRHGFAEFLSKLELPPILQQAARLDALRADVFMAPAHEPWCIPLQADPAGWALKAASDWGLFHEDWTLVDLCLKLPHLQENETLPAPSMRSQTWLIQRDAEGLVHRPLPEAQARLYELLCERSLADALTVLASEWGALASELRVQNWMAQSVSWKLWRKDE